MAECDFVLELSHKREGVMIRRFMGWLFLGGAAVFVLGISHKLEWGIIAVVVLLVIVGIIWLIKKLSRKKQGW